MNRNVAATIKEYRMLEQGDRVCVALSGGADSVALLHVLQGLSGSMGFSVTALHLNHQLRGSESLRDEMFVRRLCERWKVPLVVERAPVAALAKRRRLSVEVCARKVRYRFFARRAGELGAKIATGHTRSDTVETVLLNLIRGTGLQGLGGIPPVRGNIIRPLIGCTRQEIEAYCHRHRLPYITDSTNLQDDYTRNRIRHTLVPLFVEENPRFEALTGEMAVGIRRDAALLARLAREAEACIALGDARWSRSGYLNLDPALRPRVLHLLLGQRGLDRSRERIALLHRTIVAGQGGVQLSGDWTLYGQAMAFSLEKPRKKPHRQRPAARGQVAVVIPGLGEHCEVPLECGRTVRLFRADYENYKKTINNAQKLLKNTLDCDRIEKIIDLRHVRPADKIRPLGRGCTKTMKHLWAEGKVEPEQRRGQIGIESGGKLVWAEQSGCDESAAPGDATKQVLVITIS